MKFRLNISVTYAQKKQVRLWEIENWVYSLYLEARLNRWNRRLSTSKSNYNIEQIRGVWQEPAKQEGGLWRIWRKMRWPPNPTLPSHFHWFQLISIPKSWIRIKETRFRIWKEIATEGGDFKKYIFAPNYIRANA